MLACMSKKEYAELLGTMNEVIALVNRRFEGVEGRLDRIEDRLDVVEEKLDTKADKSDVHLILDLIDAYSKRADTYFQEHLMLSGQVDRHDPRFW